MANVRSIWHSAAVLVGAFDGTPGGRLACRPVDGRVEMSGSVTAVATGRIQVLETDEARSLLEAGKESGSLSADEITLALDALDLDPGQIDAFSQPPPRLPT